MFLPFPFPCHRSHSDIPGRGGHPAGHTHHPRVLTLIPGPGCAPGDAESPAEPCPCRAAVRGAGRHRALGVGRSGWTRAPPAAGRGIRGLSGGFARRGGAGGSGGSLVRPIRSRTGTSLQQRVTRGADTRVGRRDLRAAAAWPRSWPCPLRLRFSKGSISRQPATGINYKAALNVSDSLNGIFHSNFVIKIERPFGCDHTGIINCICLRY